MNPKFLKYGTRRFTAREENGIGLLRGFNSNLGKCLHQCTGIAVRLPFHHDDVIAGIIRNKSLFRQKRLQGKLRDVGEV